MYNVGYDSAEQDRYDTVMDAEPAPSARPPTGT
jgi:hypothetical protein